MLTLSILWVALAATVTMVAIMRKSPAPTRPDARAQSRESGSGLALLAVLYGVALVAGFLYISRFLVSSF